MGQRIRFVIVKILYNFCSIETIQSIGRCDP